MFPIPIGRLPIRNMSLPTIIPWKFMWEEITLLAPLLCPSASIRAHRPGLLVDYSSGPEQTFSREAPKLPTLATCKGPLNMLLHGVLPGPIGLISPLVVLHRVTEIA